MPMHELAKAAGVTGKTWAAYLSTSDRGPRPHRQRPLGQRKGVMIATDVASLHGDAQRPDQGDRPRRDRRGGQRPRRQAEPARHPHRLDWPTAPWRPRPATTGPAAPRAPAIVGHHDRAGPDDTPTGDLVERVARLARRLQPEALRAPAATGSSTASPPTDGGALPAPVPAGAAAGITEGSAPAHRPARPRARAAADRPPGGRFPAARDRAAPSSRAPGTSRATRPSPALSRRVLAGEPLSF